LIFAVLLHLLIFTVDIGYSFLTHACERKKRMPLQMFCDYLVLCELQQRVQRLQYALK